MAIGRVLLAGSSRSPSPLLRATRPRLSLAALGIRTQRRFFLLVLFLGSVLWLLWILYGSWEGEGGAETSPVLSPRTVLVPHTDFCPHPAAPPSLFSTSVDALAEEGLVSPSGHLRNRPRVLLIPKTSYSNAFKAVTETLVSNRIKFKSSVAGRNLPDLIKTSKGTGKFGAIFFEDFRFFLQMDSWNRELLLKYCKMFDVGLISLVPPDGLAFSGEQTLREGTNNTTMPFKLRTGMSLEDLTVKSNASMLRLTRGGQTDPGPVAHGSDWVTFQPGHDTYTEVASVHFQEDEDDDDKEEKEVGRDRRRGVVVMQDHGKLDGIRKVLFGGQLRHWVNKLLLVDALHWVSKGKIAVPLTRYMLVDIDDVFVGKHRLLPEDVDTLLQSQQRLASLVPGFKYNLGFSGGFFLKEGSSKEELEGDKAIVAAKDEFWWFPHTWTHFQAHKTDNVSILIDQMKKNRQFAEEKGLPVSNTYAVAPHHSGVYPVHQPLYEAWKQVWDIKVTSTEEYPHLRPARLRRGFAYFGVDVLPRQTCGLFTKNLLYSEFPGGPQVLEDSIHGGELFLSIVYNPISIFMTHMPNYCEDRLAPYTFESAVHMVQCWTNLRLRTRSPAKLAEIYFSMYPEERTPIWGDPCEDHRHLEIWSESKTCDRLPHLLVIGPQKTGTTALYKFLKMHPAVESNFPSEESFEELQFFSGQNYLKGVDWYMEHFPHLGNRTEVLFEKSATYFDHDLAPLRAQRLVGDAQLVAILISPSKRAYSWYQHMRAHEDPTALAHSFHEVVTAGQDAPKAVRQLQTRCLEPGKYASHLERWLVHFKAQQLHVLDGEQLRTDPVAVVNSLQRDADVRPFVDYADKLRFEKRKGFFCEVLPNGRSKCLGRGKGRHYPPMEPSTEHFLRGYYRLHNEALVKLLRTRLGNPVPRWLEEELRDADEDGSGGGGGGGELEDDDHDVEEEGEDEKRVAKS